MSTKITFDMHLEQDGEQVGLMTVTLGNPDGVHVEMTDDEGTLIHVYNERQVEESVLQMADFFTMMRLDMVRLDETKKEKNV